MNKPVFTQSGEPDLRYRATREYLARKKVNTIMGVIVAWFLFVFFLVGVIGKIMQRPVSGRESAVKTTEVQAVETTPTPTPFKGWYDNDPISYVRFKGEELGLPNDVIRTMIRIGTCESNHRPNAKNRASTASGIFQILWGTWNSYDCEGSAFNFVDNVDCAYRIYTEQSKRYAKLGKVYDFNDWNASRHCWGTT